MPQSKLSNISRQFGIYLKLRLLVSSISSLLAAYVLVSSIRITNITFPFSIFILVVVLNGIM